MTSITDNAFNSVLNGQSFALWRIKQLKLYPVQENEWGKFYSGDCYLLWDTGFQGKGAQHIYFWLGRDSSVDEQTVAAIKAVELDNLFNGMPVQHREVQGYESLRFCKMFKDGIVTMTGGAESGLKQLEKTGHVAKMFHVRGGKTPALSEVEMYWSSMNHGDTFVIDSGKMIFVWVGTKSSSMEKVAAGGLALRLRDRIGEEIVFVDDGKEGEMTEDELIIWNKLLPLEGRSEVNAVDVGGDRRVSTTLLEDISLYRVTDASGDLEVDLVKMGCLSYSDLDGNDAFIFSAKSLGVWVWLGRHSTSQERIGAMSTGNKFVTDHGLPNHTRVTKVNMGGEPEEFKSLFAS